MMDPVLLDPIDICEGRVHAEELILSSKAIFWESLENPLVWTHLRLFVPNFIRYGGINETVERTSTLR